MFGVAVDIDDFDTDRRIQMRKASYKEIQKWVRDYFNEHITNLDISNAKKELRITHNEYKGINAQECNTVRIKEKKQKLVIEGQLIKPAFHYQSQRPTIQPQELAYSGPSLK